MSYAELTFRDRNPLKRFLQRKRLRDALSVVEGAGFAGRVLDFGGGNGELSKAIARRFPKAEVICYEPAPSLFEEARQNLSGLDNALPVLTLEEVEGLRFEYVFCLEVFEHLPPAQTRDVLSKMKSLASEGGRLVVGVPNELFLAALFKGFFRMTRRYGAYDARPSNVLRAALGRPPSGRPVVEIAPGLPYHPYHLGFDHRRLRALLEGEFETVRRFGSPAAFAGPFNSEVYFVLRR